MDIKRYAIYYAPRSGVFADAVGSWLGWDPVRGASVAPPDLPLPRAWADLTRAPRKYGFHGTIKAPFRLAEDAGPEDLALALDDLAACLAPVTMQGLQLVALHGFLALTPLGDPGALMALGQAVVTGLDRFRAPLTEAEIARRRPERLSPRQRELLDRWGYPHVFEEFRFHLTLTDDLAEADREATARALTPWLMPLCPSPFVIEDLCLFGEDGEGRFHLISRHALTG